MAQSQASYPPSPQPQYPPDAGQTGVPPGWVARPPTNWRMLSGWVLFLGIALIGFAILLDAIAIAESSSGPFVGEVILGLLGIGVIIVGLSFAIGRMG